MSERELDKLLFDEPYRFEFFQAVRLFERLFPSNGRVGGDALPKDEAVRFRSHIALEFPASELHEIRAVTDGDSGRTVNEMIVSFMGMVGTSGVLPMHYTELVLDRIRHRDTAMWSFLDIFTHRSVSMFWRAWAKYRFPVAYERGSDDFTAYLFDVAGLGTRGLRGRLNIADESLLPYAGLIAQKPHSTNAIENILSDHFATPAKVQQFFGQWLALDQEDYTRLGLRNSGLGTSAIAGTRTWDQQSKFRVRLGPMPYTKFEAFLPDKDGFKAANSIIQFMTGTEFDYDIQLILSREQVPGTILTTRAKRRPMLGWTSYLKTAPFAVDDEQVVLAMEE